MVLYPPVLYYGSYAKAGIGERPLNLDSEVVKLLFNIITLVFLGLSIYLLVIDWKLFLLFWVGVVITAFAWAKVRKNEKRKNK